MQAESKATLSGMGELVRSRVLRALGLGTLWVQIDQLALRLRRVEQDLVALQRLPRGPEGGER